MKEQLISFEVAKLAKKAGFDEHGLNWLFYEENGRVFNNLEDTGEGDYVCCTQSLLQRWLRETHNIFLDVDSGYSICQEPHFGITIKSNGRNMKWHWSDKFNISRNTYEEALEYGLKVILEYLDLIIKEEEDENW